MQYIDPCPIKCDSCGYEDRYPVKELLSYKARCSKCKAPLSSAGDEMNAGLMENNIYFLKMEIAIVLEEKYSIEVNEETVIKSNTIQDFLEFTMNKSEQSTSEQAIVSTIIDTILNRGFIMESKADTQQNISEIVYASYPHKNG